MSKVGYQGIAGAFSHQACSALLPDDEAVGFAWFDVLCQSLDDGQIARAVIPIENIITGAVAPAVEALSKYDFKVHDEVWMPIVHCWLYKPDANPEEARKVFSHYQALAQCGEFIHEKGLIPEEMYDTAGAAEWLVKEGCETDSVIASELAANLYGLKIAAKNIANNKSNKTKFKIVSKK